MFKYWRPYVGRRLASYMPSIIYIWESWGRLFVPDCLLLRLLLDDPLNPEGLITITHHCQARELLATNSVRTRTLSHSHTLTYSRIHTLTYSRVHTLGTLTHTNTHTYNNKYYHFSLKIVAHNYILLNQFRISYFYDYNFVVFFIVNWKLEKFQGLLRSKKYLIHRHYSQFNYLLICYSQ